MIIHSVLKRALLTLIFLSATNICAFSQSRDTTVYFFRKVGLYGNVLTTGIDSADFFRVVPPFRLSDATVEVKEFYKDGKLRFIGNGLPQTANLEKGQINFEGTCITYFPSGKRKIITTYKNRQKSGIEYYYYPDGKQYQTLSYKQLPGTSLVIAKLETFYDKSGKEICADGNGLSIDYDESFNVIRKGPIKHGQMNGVWSGYITGTDSAKYTLLYKDDQYTSGVGYDTLGKPYAFKNITEEAVPKEGRFGFLTKFRKLVRDAYKGPLARKVLDSTRINFVVQEDGSLTNIETLDPASDEILEALKTALKQCPKWVSAKIYGIPLKAIVGLSLYVQEEDKGTWHVKRNEGSQIFLYKNAPLNVDGVRAIVL